MILASTDILQIQSPSNEPAIVLPNRHAVAVDSLHDGRESRIIESRVMKGLLVAVLTLSRQPSINPVLLASGIVPYIRVA